MERFTFGFLKSRLCFRAELGHTKGFAAFERYVLLDEPGEQVAKDLDMHVNSVYRAKEQITRFLKERLDGLRDDE